MFCLGLYLGVLNVCIFIQISKHFVLDKEVLKSSLWQIEFPGLSLSFFFLVKFISPGMCLFKVYFYFFGIMDSSNIILVGVLKVRSVISSPVRILLCNKFRKNGDRAEIIAL